MVNEGRSSTCYSDIVWMDGPEKVIEISGIKILQLIPIWSGVGLLLTQMRQRRH
jgi:hypothetical protein